MLLLSTCCSRTVTSIRLSQSCCASVSLASSMCTGTAHGRRMDASDSSSHAVRISLVASSARAFPSTACNTSGNCQQGFDLSQRPRASCWLVQHMCCLPAQPPGLQPCTSRAAPSPPGPVAHAAGHCQTAAGRDEAQRSPAALAPPGPAAPAAQSPAVPVPSRHQGLLLERLPRPASQGGCEHVQSCDYKTRTQPVVVLLHHWPCSPPPAQGSTEYVVSALSAKLPGFETPMD